jgi:hypothetical protein
MSAKWIWRHWIVQLEPRLDPILAGILSPLMTRLFLLI